MFQVNEDNSIYVTRGDAVYLKVTAEDNGKAYTFEAGEVLELKVYGKKACNDVVLQKPFTVAEATQEVELVLTEEDTKIGEIINKPRDYWYSVTLNPDDNYPQTIIGYGEDGAAVFRLFPEGGEKYPADYEPITPEDIPVVDDELDMLSPRPVQNQVIARAFANLQAGYQATHDAVAKLQVTPEMFGAIGDGEADDTEALQRAVDSGHTVVCSKQYRTTAPLIIPTGGKFICYGEIHYTGNGYAVRLGCGKSVVFIKKLVSDSVGLRVGKNFEDSYPWVAYNQVNIQEMECAGPCLLMQESNIPEGSKHGVMYNTFALSQWVSTGADCVRIDNTAKSNDDNSIFFNENTFIGGLMVGKGDGSYAVYLKSTKQAVQGSSVVSANKFIATSFEGSANGVYLCNAAENSFLDNRYEGNAITIKLSERSWDNTFKTNTGMGITQISTEELTKVNNDLHRNNFDCVFRVGASARAAYRGYVFGANRWSVEPSKRVPIMLNNTTPSVVLEGYDDLTSIYQFAENRTYVIATAANSTLQMSELYDNQQFEGFNLRLGASCTFKLLDYTGKTVFTLTNSGTDTMYAHIRNYNGEWHRDN